jgi:hypothetical protein
MPDLKRPLVGVGVIIHDNAGSIIMGERAGSHGAGEDIQTLTIFSLRLHTYQEPSNSPAGTSNMANLSQKPLLAKLLKRRVWKLERSSF